MAAERQVGEADTCHYATLGRVGAGADAAPPPAGTARLTLADVAGARAHLGWLCGRRVVAIQEHGLAQQRARPFQLACRQKGA
eukprot:2373125-Alexandrium_andersonii.AAC.1